VIQRPQLPATYSATVRGPGAAVEKRFITPTNCRIESINGPEHLIVIRRDDKGVIWVLHPKQKLYFEQSVVKVQTMTPQLFPPIDLKWKELERVDIDGVNCRHFQGVGKTRHGKTEEHIYVDPRGMFRRETCKIKTLELIRDYFDATFDAIPENVFDFDRRIYKLGDPDDRE
jgi:hypothetical protein